MPARHKPSSDALPAAKKTALTKQSAATVGASPALVTDLRQLILSAREQVARAVDSGLVLLYWSIGHRIRTDVLKEKRAEYGEKILHAVSAKLVAEFGQGFTERNLANMTRFAGEFPDPKIVHALSGQLSWTHFRRIIYLDDPLKRDFYAEMCRIEKWNTRTLHQKIQSMLYERTALSKKPDKLIATELKKLREEDKLTPDLVFRDPYVLDFLGLKDTYAEKDLEAAPMGIILCAGKSAEHVELLEVEKSGIHVAAYWTKTLPKDLLRKKLHQAVVTARANLEARTQEAKGLPMQAVATKPPKDAPTRQQGQFLAFIRETMMRNVHGVAPTHAAFQKFFNLTAPSVNSMLIRLEQRGFIRRTPGQARGIQLIIAPDLIPPLERPFKF